MQPAGGIERVVSTLANELCKNHYVTILVKDNPISFYGIDERIHIQSLETYKKLNMNSRIQRMYSQLHSFISSVFNLSSYLKDNKCDYIYVTTPLSFWECVFSLTAPRNIIASEHGARDNYNFFYKLLKLGYKLSRYYVIPTIDDYNYYSGKGYPVVYIPHLRPDLVYKTAAMDKKSIINIGRFTEDKRQILLLHIWSNIIKKHDELCDWELVLVGSGELEDEIRTAILKLNLLDNVRICPPQLNVGELYSQASIFALTSRSEGFGMVLLEAISFGVPVISFDCPAGPKDIVEDGVDGFLIKNDDVEAYELALVRLMSSFELRSRLSQSGFEKAARWNESKIVSQWMRIL